MRRVIKPINRRLSLKLSLGITLFLMVIFVVSLGILFAVSRQMVKYQAIERAELELGNMVQRVNGLMNEVEAASKLAEWNLDDKHLAADSILNYAKRIVTMNPNFDGCSISFEPNYYPQKGRYFSVYAYNLDESDSVVAKIEKPYDYFDKVYYKTPISLGKPCWVDAYSEDTEGVSNNTYYDLIVSYCVPLYNEARDLVGVISTDLSVPWLSKVISQYKPYENSYSLMLGADGQYLIHPDSTKLINKTIFTDVDVKSQQDLITLGHEMVSGNKGIMTVNLKGKRCIVLYQSLDNAPWSMALVCQESEIMAGYTKLLYILIPLLVFGLLIILAFCVNVIANMIRPLNDLTEKLTYITNGHYAEPIETTDRRDVIGRLQNNFAEMQKALSTHISSLQKVNASTKQLNKQLKEASAQAQQADEKKNEFLADMTHQIRTPLNIINGFMQVLRDDYEAIPEEEKATIVDTMQTNAININRMVNMLVVMANSGKNSRIKTTEVINVKEMVDYIAHLYATNPPYTVDLITDLQVSDDFCVKSNKEFLYKCIAELLYNAKKYTTEGYVKLTVQKGEMKVLFIVEDTGTGISKEDQKKLFSTFEKGDNFAMGLGLGLACSKQMLHLIDGDLRYDETYTNGSRFIIIIGNDAG